MLAAAIIAGSAADCPLTDMEVNDIIIAASTDLITMDVYFAAKNSHFFFIVIYYSFLRVISAGVLYFFSSGVTGVNNPSLSTS